MSPKSVIKIIAQPHNSYKVGNDFCLLSVLADKLHNLEFLGCGFVEAKFDLEEK